MLLKNRYLVDKELGRGGFGIVYLAHDQQLMNKPVVIKVLTDDLASDPWPLKKFKQEIEALARIDHPGVVGALDTGDTPEGKPFLVMQFVEGVNLRTQIQAEGMNLERAAGLVRQIGKALSAAHDCGVWHRDLKPENIMLQKPATDEEHVKLIDFGIAAIKDSQFSGNTQQNTTKVAGSFAYMAPEQFAGNPCAQSDVYAFGIIGFELLTGRKPFPVDSLFQLMMQQQQGVAVTPRQLRPNVPAAAEAAILKALSYEPTKRYQSPREFGDELAKALTDRNPTEDATASLTSAMTATAAGVIPPPPRPAAPATERLEIAHVLFMDLVSYSQLPMDKQRTYLADLATVMRSTATFQCAEKNNELLRLPTGDGVALVFFGDPEAAAQCAIEVATELKKKPHLQLRMGVHTGPVYRISDINTQMNVSGGGINMAQRVMDAGDAGHILLSKSTAEVLMQLSKWAPLLEDLGEHAVKHGVKVQLFSLRTAEVGNPDKPSKLLKAAAPPLPPAVDHHVEKSSSRSAILAAMAVLVVGLGGFGLWRFLNPPLPEQSFEYSITVHKFSDNREFTLAKEVLFEKGHGIAVNLRSDNTGYLYILNEGPLADNKVAFVVQYPAPGKASALAGGQAARIPAEQWLVFDDQPGTEKLYVVWGVKPVPELERLQGVAPDAKSGHVIIQDDSQVETLRQLMKRYLVNDTQVERNREQKRSTIRGRSDVLVYYLPLEHH